jgi:hypothetical protein
MRLCRGGMRKKGFYCVDAVRVGMCFMHD